MKNKVREQAVDYIVKEFNLLPYQACVLRKIVLLANIIPSASHGSATVWKYTFLKK